jgi:small subunit ribosomal protein S20
MPNIKSAIKRVKTSEKARVRNHARKSAFRTATKRVEKMISAGQTDGVALAASQAVSAIDRAAKTRAIHPSQAARRKSRLLLKVNSALGSAVVLEARPVETKPTKAKAKAAPKKSTAKAKTTTAKKAPAKKPAAKKSEPKE